VTIVAESPGHRSRQSPIRGRLDPKLASFRRGAVEPTRNWLRSGVGVVRAENWLRSVTRGSDRPKIGFVPSPEGRTDPQLASFRRGRGLGPGDWLRSGTRGTRARSEHWVRSDPASRKFEKIIADPPSRSRGLAHPRAVRPIRHSLPTRIRSWYPASGYHALSRAGPESLRERRGGWSPIKARRHSAAGRR
jgi:hypothetical protein